MTKKVRISILIGQIALITFGFILLAVAQSVVEAQSRAMFWYEGPAPGMFSIPGIICLIVAILLFSVLRYEVKEESR